MRLGLAGWHSIHGAILGYGNDDATPLQRWCLDNAVVPALRDVLAPALSPVWLHGAKFHLGAFDEQSIAEVRIDGVRHDACSDALLKLPWPKEGKRVARFFVLFVYSAVFRGLEPMPIGFMTAFAIARAWRSLLISGSTSSRIGMPRSYMPDQLSCPRWYADDVTM